MSPEQERALSREVGGLRCSDVLELLPEVIAGELDDTRLVQVAAHLAGCDNCARFGTLYGTAIQSLRGLRAHG